MEAREVDLRGWVLVGVTTTKIYCVPGCAGRPKRQNVRSFESTAAARAAGLRACKRCRPDEAMGEAILVDLDYRTPLDVGELLGFFARRAVPGVEELDGEVYRRSLRLPHGFGVAELRSLGDGLVARLWLDDASDRDAAVVRVRALLDLDMEPDRVVDALGGDELLGPLVHAAPGRRLPGAVDAHEIAFRAVLGQQVSLAGAATVAGRLVAAYGEPLANPVGAVTHAFPSADALAAADASAWPMPGARRRALQGLAAALASGALALDAGAGDAGSARARRAPAGVTPSAHADRRGVEHRLLALPGIGPWTAGYIAMRALHDTDAFLATDLGVRHALDRLGRDSRPAAAEQLSQAWRPYRAYALQHLWAAAS
ncbi:MAG: AraC family transcriptional regulator [Thermoleophilaceae bacterium]|nr:AraC family transcriptional regulator [Thermoleophilaceae bacterium]